MKITVITLFPELFKTVFSTSILKRAAEKKLVEYEIVDLRPFGEGRHQVVDGRPFGGGPGMVLKANILAKALNSVLPKNKNSKHRIILMSASGIPFKQSKARELSQLDQLIIVCGHYEGIDQRFIDKYVDEEISIGDYVLTGGELPAMVVADAVIRLIPGVLKKEEATKEESFSEGLLEYPQYTRPEVFDGLEVPKVLLSGNHQEVAKWRQQQSLEKTKKVRPDLLSDR
jgi:tRNA (guanine37-N1)-methyltransferase